MGGGKRGMEGEGGKRGKEGWGGEVWGRGKKVGRGGSSVQNLDTSVESVFVQVVPAFFPAGRLAGKHKSISCKSIVQNLDTSVECMFFQVLPAFFLAGQPAGKHKSISCRSIVQNSETSVDIFFFQLLFTLCLHSCLHSASTRFAFF